MQITAYLCVELFTGVYGAVNKSEISGPIIKLCVPRTLCLYEAGSRKIPASMLPILAKLFAVSLEQLVGVDAKPTKRGPASTLQRQIEQIGLMPRAKQKFITEMLEALIKQQQAS